MSLKDKQLTVEQKELLKQARQKYPLATVYQFPSRQEEMVRTGYKIDWHNIDNNRFIAIGMNCTPLYEDGVWAKIIYHPNQLSDNQINELDNLIDDLLL